MNKRSLEMIRLSLQGASSDQLFDTHDSHKLEEAEKPPKKIFVLENRIIKKADIITAVSLDIEAASVSYETYNATTIQDNFVFEYISDNILKLKNDEETDTNMNENETNMPSTSNIITLTAVEAPEYLMIDGSELNINKEKDEVVDKNINENETNMPSTSNTNTWTAVEASDHLISDDSMDRKIVPYSESSDSSTDDKKVKRKKKVDMKTSGWKQEINKRKRQFGYPYKGKRREETIWKYDVEKNGRVLKPRCKCKVSEKKSLLNCNKVTDEDREDIFNTFWKLSWDQKNVFVNNTMKISKIHRPRDRKNQLKSRRKFSNVYFLHVKDETIRVCKQMYINSLGIGEWTALNWKKQGLSDATVTTSKVPTTAFVAEKEGLERFIKTLPLMESHYCRKSTSKLYLQPDWPSKQALFKSYKIWCSENDVKPLSSCSFYNALERKNISIFKPKKDECELCTSYKSGNLQQSDYDQHVSKKDEARNEKVKDKETEKHVFAMDLQAVLLCPKSNVSSLYYKMKLKVHNFCMYNLKTKEAYCFLWNETEGGVNAEEFASIVAKLLSTEVCPFLEDDDRRIIIYSDGCTSQNRNSVMANALLNVAMLNNVVIEQKYLEKGHTQMEVDSVHACIERKMKSKVINAPAEYLGVCKEARVNPKPYNVQYLTHEYFNSYSDMIFFKSIRPGRKPRDPVVTDMKAIRYTPDGEIFYKLKFSEAWTSLPQRKNNAIVPKELTALPKLYKERLKIKKRKYDDLQSLKNSLPKDYHSYYDNIPYED